MGTAFSMLGGVWQKVTDFFTGILAIIPQVLFFIYTCCASLMDLMQFVIRKVAGLDVYYVNGEAVTGDIVSDFIYGVLGIAKGTRYSSLTTVFWSLVIFGCILLVITTIFAIIKAHYNYDAQKSNPITILTNSVKTFFLMAIIPICCIFGVYLSNILLQALDQITSYSSTTQVADVYKNSSINYTDFFEKGTTATGQEAYASYDFFGARSYTNTPTFSGILFKISCKDANRVRHESFTASTSTTHGTNDFKWADLGIFTSEIESAEDRKEDVANMIDFAFANCLSLKENKTASVLGTESITLVSSYTYFGSAVWYIGTINFSCFSKYNVGLVWYYYNLWIYNFFVAYAGMIACLAVFGSIFFGMVSRMIKLLCLFMLYPTFVGIGPLDNNSAIGKWKSEFIKNTLMGYGAVVGLNLSYFLLDEFQKIYFFQYDILNNLMSMVLIIAILVVIKEIIKIVSVMAGGEDAAGAGESLKKEAKALATKGAEKTMKAANFALKVGAKFDPTLKAMYETKKKVDAKIKKLKETRKSKTLKKKDGKPQDEDYLTNLAAEAKADSEEADLNIEMAAMEHEQSEKETDAFARYIDDKEAEGDSVDDVKEHDFDMDTSSTVPDSDRTREASYKRFRYAQRMAYADIDADTSLTDDQKDERKREARQRLKSEAIEDFRANNEHSVREGEHLDRAAQLRETSAAKQEEYDAAMKKPKRSGMSGLLMDIGGSTIKLVGNVTGVSGAWKKLDKDSGLVDEFKTFGQTMLAQEGDSVSSKLMTKKQKEDKEKADAKDRQKAQLENKNNSEIMYRKVRDMCEEIVKWRTRVFNKDIDAMTTEMKNRRLSTLTGASADAMRAGAATEIDTKVAELRAAGKTAQADALEKRKGWEQQIISDLQTMCRRIVLEEKEKGGTVTEKRERVRARIDSECAELHAKGFLQAERLLKMRKGSAISSIRS